MEDIVQMTILPCDWCGKEGHVWFQCPDPKRPPTWKPDRLKKRSERKVVVISGSSREGLKTDPSPSNFLTDEDALDPVPIVEAEMKRRGRPQTITDMLAYKAEKERQRRLLPVCGICGGKHKVGNPCRAKLKAEGK